MNYRRQSTEDETKPTCEKMVDTGAHTYVAEKGRAK